MNIRIPSIDLSLMCERLNFANELANMFGLMSIEAYTVDGDAGENWCIECGNDWFLRFTGPNTFSITHRYHQDKDIAKLVGWLEVVYPGLEVIS